MLVLSRKKGESIKITIPPSSEPSVIEIMVTKCSEQVKLGFICDRSIKILRLELVDVT